MASAEHQPTVPRERGRGSHRTKVLRAVAMFTAMVEASPPPGGIRASLPSTSSYRHSSSGSASRSSTVMR